MSSELDSRERLSALLDGEVTDSEIDQILRDLDEKPQWRSDWDRLCRARAAVEGVHVPASAAGICDGVMAAIRQTEMSPKVVPLVPRRSKRTWIEPRTFGVAAAASIAAVATVVSIRLHQQNAAAQVLAATAPATVIAQTVPVAVAAAAPAAAIDPDSQDVLDDFVIEHSNYRVVQMGTPLSYARIAAHTAEFRVNDGQP